MTTNAASGVESLHIVQAQTADEIAIARTLFNEYASWLGIEDLNEWQSKRRTYQCGGPVNRQVRWKSLISKTPTNSCGLKSRADRQDWRIVQLIGRIRCHQIF